MCSRPVGPTVEEGRAAGEEEGGGDKGRRPAAGGGGEGCDAPRLRWKNSRLGPRAPISLLVSNCSLLVNGRGLLYIFFSS